MRTNGPRFLAAGSACLGAAAFLFSSPAANAQTSVAVINEIRIDQTGGDDDEYFELVGIPSASLDGATYIVIGDDSGDSSGVIESVTDLTGSFMNASGYFVAAESTFTLGVADLTTTLSFENSDNVTHLLVEGFTGASGDDLDTDDDGVLDTTPWSFVIDCIGLVEEVGGGNLVYCTATVGPDGSFVPGHSFRCEDQFGDFIIGEFDIAAGDDTPGGPNNCPGPPADPVINEIRIDQPSSDNDEYFELKGNPAGSLDGLSYIVIGDDSGGSSGVIESVTDLTGSAIDANGYFVAAEATFTLGTADLTTSMNFENSDNVTHMLVDGFTGADGDDLDTDDDGVLDTTPWTSIVDCVALVEEVGAGEQIYCANTVGPDGTFVPGHSFRCADGVGDFIIGEFDPLDLDDTPGATNACPPPVVDAVINEILIDHSGDDVEEFFELSGSGSLDRVWYIVIGDATPEQGIIEHVTDLTGQTIGGSGYFVGAEATFSLGVADFTTDLNFENSDNVTHMLVTDFTGSNGDDIDFDDDGVLDVTPWSSVVDCIALLEEVGGGDHVYCTHTVGPDGTFVPGHAYRCEDTTGPFIIGTFGFGDESVGATNDCIGTWSNYCVSFPNSVSVDGAVMAYAGTGVIAANDSVISCSNVPNQFGLFFFGTASDFVAPFGNGVLCVAAPMTRLGLSLPVSNSVSRVLDFTGGGPESAIVGGASFFFQYWYRDPGQGAGFNTSDGLQVNFVP